VRLPQFAIVLLSSIVIVVALGSVGGLDTVETATTALVITGALIVWFVRQPRQPRPRLHRE
jgi:hypothetical protein